MVKIHLFEDFKPGKIYKFAGNCILDQSHLFFMAHLSK